MILFNISVTIYNTQKKEVIMKKNHLIFAVLCSLVFTLVSCATTVNVNLTRPANLDLNGAKTIAVLPIKPYAYYREYDTSIGTEILINTFYQMFEITDPDEDAAIRAFQGTIENGLMQSPYISLVSAAEVLRAQKNGYINPADVYLTGEISYFNINDTVTETKKTVKEAEGNRKAEYEIIKTWNRNVECVFRYQVVDSSTNKVISYREIKCEDQARNYEYKRDLPTAYSIIESEVKYAGKKILKELQPYVVTKSIKLLQTKTKDKELKERFKANEKLADKGLLKEASAAFTALYKETDLVEAGYNAAILQEALGNLSRAEKMMTELYNKHPDNRVAKGLADIRYEIGQAERLNKQINSSDSTDL